MPQHQEVLPPEAVTRPRNERGAGRKPGSPNKVGGNIRQMILDAIESLGGENYFIALAVTQPQAFAALVGRVLPTVVVLPENPDAAVTEIRRTYVVMAPPKK